MLKTKHVTESPASSNQVGERILRTLLPAASGSKGLRPPRSDQEAGPGEVVPNGNIDVVGRVVQPNLDEKGAAKQRGAGTWVRSLRCL